MTKQYVFESKVNDECILEHIESAFDLPSRHAAQIHIENWGVMVHIIWASLKDGLMWFTHQMGATIVLSLRKNFV